MTETNFIVFIDDITKVRVTCGNCNTSHEFPVDELHRAFGAGRCRYCEHQWHEDNAPAHDAFKQLGEALKRLANNKRFRLGFPIPVED